jgi:hypothetical protein
VHGSLLLGKIEYKLRRGGFGIDRLVTEAPKDPFDTVYPRDVVSQSSAESDFLNSSNVVHNDNTRVAIGSDKNIQVKEDEDIVYISNGGFIGVPSKRDNAAIVHNTVAKYKVPLIPRCPQTPGWIPSCIVYVRLFVSESLDRSRYIRHADEAIAAMRERADVAIRRIDFAN